MNERARLPGNALEVFESESAGDRTETMTTTGISSDRPMSDQMQIDSQKSRILKASINKAHAPLNLPPTLDKPRSDVAAS